jgi:hypothetical protein
VKLTRVVILVRFSGLNKDQDFATPRNDKGFIMFNNKPNAIRIFISSFSRNVGGGRVDSDIVVATTAVT